MKWIKNRCISLVLTAGNMAFWLCLRDLSPLFDQYPFLMYVYQLRVQIPAFIVLGATLMWTMYAFKTTGGKRRVYARTLCCGIAFVLFQQCYNLLLRRRIYVVNPWMELICVCIGAALFGWILGRVKRDKISPEEGRRVSWESVSVYRSQLMGVAMLGVILEHSRSTNVPYVLPLDFISRIGSSGVDMFLFVSGIGMVYSLSKNSNTLAFYKRRVRKFFPETMPWIAMYSLHRVAIGKIGIGVFIANCLGIGYWVSASGFNWYYSFILLLYLVSPLMYRLLRRRETRYGWAVAMIAASMAFLFFLYDVLDATRMYVSFSRGPIFVIGMLAGFWLQEGITLSREEYRSLLPIVLVFSFLAYESAMLNLSPIIGCMLFCYCIFAPGLCLLLSRLFCRVKDGWLMRFLRWTGENSLLLFVLNIILRKLYTSYIHPSMVRDVWKLLGTTALIVVNFLIVLLVQLAKERLSRRRTA